MKLAHVLFLTLFVAVLLALLSKSTKINNRIRNEIYGNNKLKGKYYSINGFQMYCEIYGSGEPLLLIHGNGGSINAFAKQIPYFSRRFKVIVADSRAQGKSGDSGDSLSYEQMADDFNALLTTLQIDSANVIGWSDGGINGLLLAMRHPEKVKKLVITGANLWPDSTAVSKQTLEETMPSYLKLKKMFSEPVPKTPADSTQFKLLKLLIEQPHIPLTDLQKIKAPTLVIGGDRDVVKPEHTLLLFQHIPSSNLWILPRCGHGTLIDYAAEFNAKTAAFIRTPYEKTGRLK
jgi:pimeloyl-ACP methyl ester carboxylesterase